MQRSKRASRRRHSAELKTRVLAECAEPGASVAAVALAHGLNANLVHRWRRLGSADIPAVIQRPLASQQFVPLSVAAEPAAADIRIELRRGATAVQVHWPQAGAAECAAWLTELLR